MRGLNLRKAQKLKIMDNYKDLFSPTLADMTVAEPAERQLALLLTVERFFEDAIAKNGEDDKLIFLCVLLVLAEDKYNIAEEQDLLMRMIRSSCTEKENKNFIASPFRLFQRDNTAKTWEEMNKHRAFWLDFMILVLADEAEMKLVEDKSVSGGSYA